MDEQADQSEEQFGGLEGSGEPAGLAPVSLQSLLASAHRLWRTPPTFDAALLNVSNCLTEAEHYVTCGHTARARQLYRLAELCAMHSGFLELVRLVWAYDSLETAPAVERP